MPKSSTDSKNKIFALCMLSCSVCSALWIPWAVAHQSSLSMEFSRQEYWSGLPFPTPEDLPKLGIKPTSPVSPALASCASWEALKYLLFYVNSNVYVKSNTRHRLQF